MYEAQVPDATTAVIAHGLLNSVAIVNGAARTLRESWEALAPSQRMHLLSMITDQAEHVASMLGDLARGLPAGVRHELEALAEGHQAPAP